MSDSLQVPTSGLPPKQGLYDPRFEHDACGVGFVVNIKGVKSHEIIRSAMTILLNLTHRGAKGAEPITGDGAGILLQIPDRFFRRVCPPLGIDLPEAGQYGVGMVFLPQDEQEARACEQRLEEIIAAEGQRCLGWRTVPTDGFALGKTARSREPVVRQVFIGGPPPPTSPRTNPPPTSPRTNPPPTSPRNLGEAQHPPAGGGSEGGAGGGSEGGAGGGSEGGKRVHDDLAFERKLYVIRKQAEKAIRYAPDVPGCDSFYFASFSSRTIVYKGMLLSEQVEVFYPELDDPSMESALAIVHSRFSTNTFPSWERAHPYRYLIHNGEINTLRGNINWMHARQSLFASELFGDDMAKVLPVIDADGSDSAMFDNALEFLYLSGRSLPHAVMMMIPEPWSKHESMSDEKKAFYEFHSTIMEPWDGPASIAFTDGAVVGAVLDRNGLRPSRYYVTKDDLVIMASEVGVLDVPPENVLYKSRLQPGRMFLVDTRQGRIISDEEIKHTAATAHPYRAWLDEHLTTLEDLPDAPLPAEPDHDTVVQRQQAFGYSYETLRVIMGPMAQNAIEPIGSMGNDTPLAVLSDQSRLLYDYFKQLFAQVTNPPIDAIREELITATEVMMGTELNLLDTRPEDCHQIKLQTPILTNEELAKLRHIELPGFRSLTLPMLFDATAGPDALEQALADLYLTANQAVRDGVNILILSDRGVGSRQAAIPALLAVSGLHHYLIREELRTQVALIIESGEPREVHHFALLVGYGATAINPYLAYETLDDMVKQGLLPGLDVATAHRQYIKASVKGVVKTLSKMGISTMQSYCGAQIFEALGLNQAFVDKYFTWTPTRIEGIGLEEVYEEVHRRHRHAFPTYQLNGKTLPAGGDYKWRAEGERHLLNPQTIYTLQKAVRSGDYETFKAYTRLIDEQAEELYTLRGLLELKFDAEPVPLDEVEPVESIVKRFKTGAMSYGSISQETHETMAIAMNRLGGKSNSGEGGEHPSRFTPDENGDLRSSAIKQVASGRFGVTSEYLVSAKEIQIKMAQGAKPGEGGQLPGRKVYPWIAEVRYSTPGVGLISPPPHHDIYSIEDLAELIFDLKNANPKARINVKLVSEVGVGTIAAGVAKGHADVILISGYDGGTGASPQSSIKHAGLPWELGLSETHQTLALNGLRSRVVLETDGQLRTGRDLVIAALLGAEEYGFGTISVVALGCVMMRVCHMDTCPVGVATQNPALRKKFAGKPEHIIHFMRFVAQDMREIMAKLGFRTVDEMVGRSDRLEMRKAVEHWKARGLDFSNILYQPQTPGIGRYHQFEQDHGLSFSLDYRRLLDLCEPALARGEPVKAQLSIRNTNRVVGTILGSELTRRYGGEGLPPDTIRLQFQGSAGQSFGAFIPRGITLELEGDANDYVGKGLSGGKIVVYPPRAATFVAEENIIIGNVALYGATSGEAYIRGVAGERFCVRNSGAYAVVEGVGDHACEYMTGGRVVVLGQTGRNFAAGMSGGIAYVFDWHGDFAQRCNRQMVELERLQAYPDELTEVKGMITRHARFTDSALAQRILLDWDALSPGFVRVIPKDYKRMLAIFERVQAEGLSGEEAVMAAFEINKSDLSRVSGN